MRSKAWLKGGCIGFLIPATFLGIFLLLKQFDIALGANPITGSVVILLGLMEMPIMVIGKVLPFPITNSQSTFILSDLNFLGYALTFLFWAVIGAGVGALTGRKKDKDEKN